MAGRVSAASDIDDAIRQASWPTHEVTELPKSDSLFPSMFLGKLESFMSFGPPVPKYGKGGWDREADRGHS